MIICSQRNSLGFSEILNIHFHIVPRWNGDTNFMPVIGEIKVISQDLAESKRKLIDAYKKFGK